MYGVWRMISMTPHHIGCAVSQIEDSYETYAGALGFGRRTRSFDVTSQHVRVCFADLGNRFYLELIAPLDDKAKLSSFLKVGFYHLCFLVDDLSAARKHLALPWTVTITMAKSLPPIWPGIQRELCRR